jgi:hypothetical protein
MHRHLCFDTPPTEGGTDVGARALRRRAPRRRASARRALLAPAALLTCGQPTVESTSNSTRVTQLLASAFALTFSTQVGERTHVPLTLLRFSRGVT